MLRPGVNLIGSGPDRTVIFGSVLRLGEQFPDPEIPPCDRPTAISGFRLVDCALGVWQAVPPLALTVSDCYFDGSRVSVDGGSRWDITFRQCAFRNIREVLGRYALHASHTGALKVDNCEFDLSDSLGRTGGVALFGTYPAVVSGCTFTACATAIYCFEGNASIMNCVFLGNDRGIEVVVADTTIEASTFVGNGHAIWTTDQCERAPTLRNCVLWGSAEANVLIERSDGFGVPQISFSDVEGGYPGQGNIDADPMFFLPSADEPDLHLCAFSPCVDAGDPLSDYSNEPEPNGARVNMGAYGGTWEATTSELTDSDGDNLRDDWEIERFGTLDRDGMGDADGDSLSERDEYRYLANPNNPDTDADTLSDGEEVFDLGTNPTLADTDNDGTTDGKEVGQGTDPLDPWDAFTIITFSIENDQIQVVHPVQPRCWYELQSSFFPAGPFGIVCPNWEGRFGVSTHTFVVDVSPYARFYRIEARPY